MATLDLWIEGGWGREEICWSQEIGFDFDRFQYDDFYAHVVSEHIKRGLEHLAKEVQELGIALPLPKLALETVSSKRGFL